MDATYTKPLLASFCDGTPEEGALHDPCVAGCSLSQRYRISHGKCLKLHAYVGFGAHGVWPMAWTQSVFAFGPQDPRDASKLCVRRRSRFRETCQSSKQCLASIAASEPLHLIGLVVPCCSVPD